jgi:Flp pilus assembly protein TadD
MKKKTTTPRLEANNPSQQQLDSLLKHYQNGRYSDAEELALSIIEEFPKDQFTWKVLGAVFGAVGRNSQALDANLTAVTLSPQDAAAHNNLGISYQELGKLDEAESSYRQAIALKPDYAEAQNNLGITYQELGKLDEAESSYRQAIALKPDYAEAYFNLGITLQELGRYYDAESNYTKVVILKPDYAEAHSNLGEILYELDKLNEAEVSLRQAITLKPDLAGAHYNLGVTLKELGKLDEAESSYRQAIALKPDYAEAQNNLGNTLLELGRCNDAEANYREAIALKPDYAEAHSNLGEALNQLGKLNEAEVSLRQAITLKPDLAVAHFNLGITLKEQSKLNEAEVSLRQTVALKPDYAEASNQLLDCLFLQDKKSIFFDELDNLISQGKASAIIGSLTSRSGLRYGLEKPNVFCKKPLNYVSHSDLSTRYDFEKIFIEKAKSILSKSLILNRRQSLLVNGSQSSGNIFDIKNNDTNEIQNIIRIEVEKYRIKFKESEEGLIKKMPAEYTLNGWFISMKSGGSLKPHIHSEGWLSGSIYINVPQKLDADSGKLVVSLGEENDVRSACINEKKTIDVATGSMVLFPASLMHYTIPFESKEDRIVLAFDVKEK